jgi:hypothetical protein
VYFAFFPLGYTDELYSEYFGDMDFYGVGDDITPKQKRALKNRIIAISILSIVIGVVVTPALIGFIAATYLSVSDFFQFLAILGVVKGALLVHSWVRLKWHAPFYELNKRLGVAGLYVGYLVLVLFGLWWSFDLTSQSLATLGFWQTILELAKYTYVQYGLAVGCVAAVTWAVTNANLKE